VQGATGPTGAQGVKGDTGNTGATGPAGPAGLNWRGAWSNSNAYAINDSVSWGGSTYFATVAKTAGSAPPTGTAGSPGDDATVNAGWAALALEGTQGPTGATGATGAQGPIGATGPQGAQGVQGNTGSQGPTGPTGATGAQGPTGSTGQRGSKWFTGVGAPGTIAGSAIGDQYLDTATGDVYGLS
jgi:hypothetical protein